MRNIRTHWVLGVLGLVAMILTACGADGGDPSSEEQVGSNSPLAETGPELSLGSNGSEVAEVNRYLTDYGYFPNDELTRFDPRWRSPIAEGPARIDVFDDSTRAGLELLQQNYGLPKTGVLDADTRTFLRSPRCGTPDNVPVTDPGDKFGVQLGNWGGLVKLKWRLANAPPTNAGFSYDEARGLLNAVFRDWERYSRHEFVEVPPGSGEAIVIAFANTFSQGCPAAGRPVGNGNPRAIAAASPPQPGGTTCAFFRTDVQWSMNLFKAAALHEIGHTFGLSHSGYSNVAMSPNVGPTVTAADDKAAAIANSVHWNLLDQDGDADLAVVGADPVDVYVLGNPRIGNDLTLWKLDHAIGWQKMSTTIGGKRVGASASQVWMVQDDGDVYRYNGSSWFKLNGKCGTDISVGADDSVWMLGCSSDANGNHSIYQWNGSQFVRDEAVGASALRISVGRRLLPDSLIVPWIVKHNPGDISGAGLVYRRDGNNTNDTGVWQDLPPLRDGLPFSAVDVSANNAGYTWVASNIPIADTGGHLMVFDEQGGNLLGDPLLNFGWIGASFGGGDSGAGVFIGTSDWGVPYTTNNVGQLWVAD